MPTEIHERIWTMKLLPSLRSTEVFNFTTEAQRTQRKEAELFSLRVLCASVVNCSPSSYLVGLRAERRQATPWFTKPTQLGAANRPPRGNALTRRARQAFSLASSGLNAGSVTFFSDRGAVRNSAKGASALL